MYTVESIQDNIVVLEDRKTRKIIDVNLCQFDSEIKVNDIVKYDDNINKYIVNLEETNIIKNNIRARFNKLKK